MSRTDDSAVYMTIHIRSASVYLAASENSKCIMTITPEQEIELAKFPAALRFLIETELASGNAIIEVGHSFPAPPAGAYIKLANKVSTRARTIGDELSFYERNSSIYSGEFTDSHRFYFILEPPNPAPAESEMHDIRVLNELSPTTKPNIDSTASQAISIEEVATGSTRVLHFIDKRPPLEMKFALERDIRTLFKASMEHDKLCLRAKANVVGIDYDFLLHFEAALPAWNCFALRLEVSWGEPDSSYVDYYRKNAGSWFKHWTSEFTATNPPDVNEGSSQLYRELCEEVLNAEQQLDSVTAIQQSIIAAVKAGASFQTSHKEGDTKIYWKNSRFVRSDDGDYPNEQQFTNEFEFLKMLHQFCHWDATRHSGTNPLTEFDTWRLILHRMHLPHRDGPRT